MYHIFFIYSSVDGHLGCFHALPIVNGAEMSIGVHVSFFLFSFFWLCWVFIAACGLFSSSGEQGLLFVAVHGLLIVVASLVAEHEL